jgi:ATP-dependent Clp protease protease subunit
MSEPKKKQPSESEPNLPTFHQYYEDICKSRVDPQQGILWLDGVIGEEIIFSEVDAALSLLETEHKVITIKLNTVGGGVTEAFAIAGRIATSKSKIIIEASGIVASAGILLLSVGHMRISTQFTSFMHHDSHSYLNGRLHNLQNTLEAIKRDDERFNNFLGKYTNRDSAWWSKKSVPEFWFDASEAKDIGLIDHIIEGSRNGNASSRSSDNQEPDSGLSKPAAQRNKSRNKKAKKSDP